jgi:glycopeptide antibiotics resistance protein
VPWLVAIAAYSVFLIVGFWYPFDFTTDRTLVRSKIEGFFRVPFLALYVGSEFNALKQLLVRVLFFAPLGVMWAYVASLARTTAARHLLLLVGIVYATVLALGIEMVEVLMPSKVADSTEVVLCMAGALAGLIVAWRMLSASTEAARPSRRR